MGGAVTHLLSLQCSLQQSPVHGGHGRMPSLRGERPKTEDLGKPMGVTYVNLHAGKEPWETAGSGLTFSQ